MKHSYLLVQNLFSWDSSCWVARCYTTTSGELRGKWLFRKKPSWSHWINIKPNKSISFKFMKTKHFKKEYQIFWLSREELFTEIL